MKKDVVYIDVDDDITAIIGKVKDSKEKVVALVPPKRIGVLQSAVNLRLLSRTAQNDHKHLVLVTNNHALMSLASVAKIPVAKNLQSQPELAEVPALAVDDDDDIIDGKSLPIGDHAKTVKSDKPDAIDDKLIAGIDVEDDDTIKASPPVVGSEMAKANTKKGIKVPSFNDFRKKLIIIVGLVILLIAFLIWAIFFAGRATVVVTAQTTPAEVNTSVAIGSELETDPEMSTLKSIVQQEKKEASVEFEATGTDEVGDKAAGTMTVKRDLAGCSNNSSLTVPVGTQFSSGQYTFVSTEAVVLEKCGFAGGGISLDEATINVSAASIGEEYNLTAREYTPSTAGIDAEGSAMSGGSKRQIQVVTQADVVAATTKLQEQKHDDIEKSLKSKFKDDTFVINSSFVVEVASPVSAPAIGDEAKGGKATLTSELTFSVSGIAKSELKQYLKAALESQINKDEQRVYNDGSDKVKISDFKHASGNTSITLEAQGQVGPKIDDDEVKELAKGKRFGEIQEELKQINGVVDAETKFWPFWVSTVPDDVEKIKIEFKLNNDDKNE